jgi:hypothetical protein
MVLASAAHPTWLLVEIVVIWYMTQNNHAVKRALESGLSVPRFEYPAILLHQGTIQIETFAN